MAATYQTAMEVNRKFLPIQWKREVLASMTAEELGREYLNRLAEEAESKEAVS